MWIVKQNGTELVKVSEIEIADKYLFGTSVRGRQIRLGTYDSEKDAKYVFNDILRALTSVHADNPVYSMPENIGRVVMTVKYAELCSRSIRELAKRRERKNRIAENEATNIAVESIRRTKRRYGIV